MSTTELKRKVFLNISRIVSVTSLKPLIDDFITERVFEFEDWGKITTKARSISEENKRFLNALLNTDTHGFHLLLLKLKQAGYSDLVTTIVNTTVTEDIDREIAVHLRQNKDNGNVCVPVNIREQNEAIKKMWEKENDAFVRTRATKKLLELIDKTNVLTISGNGGTGKSATIHHLALKLKERGYEVLLVHKPDEMKTYLDPSKKQVFLTDDPVGVYGLDKQRFELWVQYSSALQCLLHKNVKFLCSIRKEVINEPEFNKESCILNKTIFNLQDENYFLNEDEKLSMLKSHLKNEGCDIELIDEVKRIIKDTHEQFPLICQLFCSSKDLQQYGVEIFLKPFGVVLQNLDSLQSKEKSKYCTLVICYAFGNQLDPDLFDPFEGADDSKTQPFLDVCHINKVEFVGALQQNLESLSGVYLKQQDGIYQFIHDFIYDVVAYHFGKKHPKQMLKYSPSRFISERVVVCNNAKCRDPYLIVLEAKYIPSLLKRLIDDLEKGNYYDVMMNRCWSENAFMDLFVKDFMANKDKRMTLFCSKITHKLDFVEKIRSNIVQMNDNDISQTWTLNYITADLLQIPNITLIHCAAVYAHRRLFDVFWQNLSLANKEVSSLDRHSISKDVPILHYACLGGDIDICKTILQDVNCDVNDSCFCEHSVFENGITCEYFPLQLAAMKSVDITELLLDRGANVNDRVQRGGERRSAITWASGFGNIEIVTLLMQRGADINNSYEGHIIVAAQNNKIPIIKLLIENGVFIDTPSYKTKTPLMAGAIVGHKEVVELLITHKASLDKQTKEGLTALMIASERGYTEIVELLISHEASIDVRDKDGRTALMMASRNCRTEVVQLLCTRNAKINMKDNDGRTALMIATHEGHSEIMQLFLSHNASEQ